MAGELVLICPPLGCPTGEVYRVFDERAGERPGARLRADDVGRLASEAVRTGEIDDAGMFNDLEGAAMAVRPELAEVKKAVEELLGERLGGRRVHVSGSGSTLFVFGGEDVARAINGAAGGALPAGTRAIATRLAGADCAAGTDGAAGAKRDG